MNQQFLRADYYKGLSTTMYKHYSVVNFYLTDILNSDKISQSVLVHKYTDNLF